MLTFSIFLLLIITLSLVILKKRAASRLFSLLTVVSFVVVGCGIFSSLALKCLETPNITPNWLKTNAIVLLGAGTVILPNYTLQPTILAYSRINEAAKLYFSCKKTAQICKVIVSGGDASRTGQSEAAVYFNELMSLGISKADVILEDQSLNTYQNAELTSAILKSHAFQQIFLVTSEIHMKRALLYFSNFKIIAISAVADYFSPTLSMIPIGYHFAIADFIVHEYIGIIRFYVYQYLGWNKQVTSPGAF